MKIVTPENYYEDDEYFSVSSFKKFNACEVNGLRGVYNQDPSPSMLIGQYVDSYVEGTLKQFRKEHPEVFSTRGKSKGELKSEFQQAEEICRFIDNDPIFSQFMSGEKQRVMTGEIAGVPFKIKMDSYSPDVAINDLKVMRSVTDRRGQFVDFITPWGYEIQMSCYQEIVYQNTGKKLPCFICAVTKESPINSVIVNIPQTYLDIALYNVQEKIGHYYNIKTGKEEAIGCGVCNTCILNRTETQIISLEDIISENF
jgi:hypothetical protein